MSHFDTLNLDEIIQHFSMCLTVIFVLKKTLNTMENYSDFGYRYFTSGGITQNDQEKNKRRRTMNNQTKRNDENEDENATMGVAEWWVKLHEQKNQSEESDGVVEDVLWMSVAKDMSVRSACLQGEREEVSAADGQHYSRRGL